MNPSELCAATNWKTTVELAKALEITRGTLGNWARKKEQMTVKLARAAHNVTPEMIAHLSGFDSVRDLTQSIGARGYTGRMSTVFGVLPCGRPQLAADVFRSWKLSRPSAFAAACVILSDHDFMGKLIRAKYHGGARSEWSGEGYQVQNIPKGVA